MSTLVLDLMAWKRRFFFFQAEDGIRYLYVTGVQTCALPISGRAKAGDALAHRDRVAEREHRPATFQGDFAQRTVGIDGGWMTDRFEHRYVRGRVGVPVAVVEVVVAGRREIANCLRLLRPVDVSSDLAGVLAVDDDHLRRHDLVGAD